MRAFRLTGAPSVFATGLVALDVLCAHDGSDAVRYRVGGTAGNVAAILGALGWASTLAGPDEQSPAYALMHSDLSRCRVNYFPAARGTAVPVIVQELTGTCTHQFRFDCPKCGKALPRYQRAAYASDDELVSLSQHADIFFVDRLSNDILELATRAHLNGSFVVYEPSDPNDAPWLEPMLGLAHMVKWSSERAAALPRLTGRGNCLEVQTLGSRGVRWRWPHIGQETWQIIRAARTARVIDTCGAGDWLTSGILMGLVGSTFDPDYHASKEFVRVLQRAQRLAAWSCGFAGARGGLYRAGPAKASAVWQSASHKDISDPLPDDFQVERGCSVCPS